MNIRSNRSSSYATYQRLICISAYLHILVKMLNISKNIFKFLHYTGCIKSTSDNFQSCRVSSTSLHWFVLHSRLSLINFHRLEIFFLHRVCWFEAAIYFGISVENCKKNLSLTIMVVFHSLPGGVSIGRRRITHKCHLGRFLKIIVFFKS